MVKMIAQDGSGNDWLWDRNKFINRKFIMQEMYQNFVEGEPDWDLPQVRPICFVAENLTQQFYWSTYMQHKVTHSLDLNN